MGILPANLPANDEGDDDLGSDNEEDEDDEDGDDGVDDDADEEGEENDDAGMGQKQQSQAQQQRQYTDETSRVLWVSYPALHPELNLHVWEAAGKLMPLIRSGPRAVEDKGGLFGDGARGIPPVNGEGAEPMEGVEQAQQQQVENEMQDPLVQEVNSHPGAGTGVIGGAGSSLNHVVAVEWSPSGLGRNLRPVLAVLTGCGSLAIYGEGGPLPFGSNAKPSRVVGGFGKSAVRDLQSWLALWAVGENFVVPGQEEFGYGEFVKAFSWCEELSAGRALLSYMNDLREIVILSVGTTFRKTEDGLEEAIWNVQEVARMETGGPHGQVDVSDSVIDDEAVEETDGTYRRVIQIMSHLDQATACDGVLGQKARTHGPVSYLTWTGTTSASRKSPSILPPGAQLRARISYRRPQTGTVNVCILLRTLSWNSKIQ